MALILASGKGKVELTLVASNITGSFNMSTAVPATVDCTTIPNYQNLTTDDFFIEAVSARAVINPNSNQNDVSAGATIASYNNSTGTLSLNLCRYSSNVYVYNTVNVYVK